MTPRIRDVVLGAGLVVPFVPLAWLLGGNYSKPSKVFAESSSPASGCDCRAALDELRALLKEARVETPAASVVPLSHQAPEGAARAVDAPDGLSPDVKADLNRYFAVLWRTSVDDAYGIRSAVLKSGKSPFDPGVDEKMADAWKSVFLLRETCNADIRAIKLKYPLVVQYDGKQSPDVPDGVRKSWVEETNAYSRECGARMGQLDNDISVLIKELRRALSSE